MIKKSQLKKQIEKNQSEIFDLRRKLFELSDAFYANKTMGRYTKYEVRLKILEDVIGQLVELKYPENMNEQQKVFFQDTLERMKNMEYKE